MLPRCAELLCCACRRVPITDGKVPGHDDVAHIHSSLAAAGPRSNFVFNCQQGKGRTTIGMAMASLFLSAQARPPSKAHRSLTRANVCVREIEVVAGVA